MKTTSSIERPGKIETWVFQEKPLTQEQVEMLKPGSADLVIIDAQKHIPTLMKC